MCICILSRSKITCMYYNPASPWQLVIKANADSLTHSKLHEDNLDSFIWTQMSNKPMIFFQCSHSIKTRLLGNGELKVKIEICPRYQLFTRPALMCRMLQKAITFQRESPSCKLNYKVLKQCWWNLTTDKNENNLGDVIFRFHTKC